MSEWVKFHGELTKGAKRGLPRAVRFIYMELALLARPRAGSIDLPIGMDDADGVADLLGGNQAEIKLAIRLLTSGQDPMIRFEGDAGARRCVVVSWSRWNEVPGASTERVRRYRERQVTDMKRVTRNGSERFATDEQPSGNAPRGEERREEKIRSISEPLSPPSPTETSRAPAGALGGGGLPEIFRSELAKHAETAEIASTERHVQALAMSAFERGLRPDMVGDAVSWAAERLRIVRATAGDGCPLTDEATLLEVTKGIRGAVKKQARSAGPGGVSRVQPDAEAWANGGGYRR